MIRKWIFFIIASISAICSNGQGAALCKCDSLYAEISEPKLTGDPYLEKNAGSVSPYFMDDWNDGTILLSNAITVKSKNLRYNGYIDRLIRMTENYQQVKLDKEAVDGFCLRDKRSGGSYTFRKIKIKAEYAPDSAVVYAQLLFENKLSLYAYRQVVLAKTGEMQKKQNVFEIFEKKPVYYFKLPDNKLHGLRRISRRNILKLFPGNEEQVDNLLFTAKQHRFRTEEDLMHIAGLLDGIK